jgi:predicted RNase H-like nuclease (RuvC/YqgF family)
MIINEKLKGKFDDGISFIKKNRSKIIKGTIFIAVVIIGGLEINNIIKQKEDKQTTDEEMPESYEEDISYEYYDTADKFLWDYSPAVRIDDLSDEEKRENIDRYSMEINKLKDKYDDLREEKMWWHCSNPEYDPMEGKINETLFEIDTRQRYIENLKISLYLDNEI